MKNTTHVRANIDYKPSRWLRFYIAIGIVEALLTLFWVASGAWLDSQTGGDSAVGGSLVLGILFTGLFVLAAPFALFTLIGLPIHLLRQKPHGKWLAFGLIALIFCIMPVIFGAKIAHLYLIEIPGEDRTAEQRDKDAAQQLDEPHF